MKTHHVVSLSALALLVTSVALGDARNTRIQADASSAAGAGSALLGQTIYVDDDAPNDPGPNDPNISDPRENGSALHPFDRIQEALDIALTVDTVQVAPGLYEENLTAPSGGCTLAGSGRTATLVRMPSNGGLSAWLTLPAPSSPGFTLTDLSLENGLLDIYASDGAGIGITLRDLAMVNVTVSLLAGYFSGGTTLTMDSVDMTGGSLALNSSGTTLYSAISRLNAPNVGMELGHSVSGVHSLGVSDSTMGTIFDDAYSDYGVGLTATTVHFTGQGIDLGGPLLSLSIADCSFDLGGVRVTVPENMDVGGHSASLVSRSVFLDRGVTFTVRYFGNTTLGLNASMRVDSCAFHGQGVTGSIGPSWLNADTPRNIELYVTNSIFDGVPAGVRVTNTLDGWEPGVGGLRTTVGILNNSMWASPTGLEITTSPHPPGSEINRTQIQNNLVVGGGTGIVVHGTGDQQFIIVANDLHGQSVARYSGDLPDQTGVNGNISIDPQYVNPGADDFRLAPDSPCIDSGAGGVNVPSSDYAGTPRPLDGNLDGAALPDIGALEFPPDADGDGYDMLNDCNDAIPIVWATPGEVLNLIFSDSQTLQWEPPHAPGGVSVYYDTLRSVIPTDFLTAAVCTERWDARDTWSLDADLPRAGSLFYYLVRANNTCVPGEGPLGFGSDGTPHAGRSCL